MIDLSYLSKPVETYYGYEFNEFGFCLNPTMAFRIIFNRTTGIEISTFRTKTGMYDYHLHYELGLEGGWGGYHGGGEPGVEYVSQRAAVLAALEHVKRDVSDGAMYDYQTFKRKWQSKLLKRLNVEIKNLTIPKQMSIFDYTTETLNFHNQ